MLHGAERNRGNWQTFSCRRYSCKKILQPLTKACLTPTAVNPSTFSAPRPVVSKTPRVTEFVVCCRSQAAGQNRVGCYSACWLACKCDMQDLLKWKLPVDAKLRDCRRKTTRNDKYDEEIFHAQRLSIAHHNIVDTRRIPPTCIL